MAPLEDLLTREEHRAFFNRDSDRAKAIVLGSIVENHLTAVLKLGFRSDEKLWNELFRPSGALGDFGIKIRIAYMAGLIDARLKDDLIIVSRIRNEFAHNLLTKRFSDQPVCQWIRNMQTYVLLVHIRDRKPRFATVHGKIWDKEMSRVKRKALRSMRTAYRECLGHILHYLVLHVEHKLIKTNREKDSGRSSSPEKSA